jgi:hypothetical protein
LYEQLIDIIAMSTKARNLRDESKIVSNPIGCLVQGQIQRTRLEPVATSELCVSDHSGFLVGVCIFETLLIHGYRSSIFIWTVLCCSSLLLAVGNMTSSGRIVELATTVLTLNEVHRLHLVH